MNLMFGVKFTNFSLCMIFNKITRILRDEYTSKDKTFWLRKWHVLFIHHMHISYSMYIHTHIATVCILGLLHSFSDQQTTIVCYSRIIMLCGKPTWGHAFTIHSTANIIIVYIICFYIFCLICCYLNSINILWLYFFSCIIINILQNYTIKLLNLIIRCIIDSNLDYQTSYLCRYVCIFSFYSFKWQNLIQITIWLE